MLYKIISVLTGGALGALLRYLTTILANKIFSVPLIGTFVVNILGCFMIGWLFGLSLNKAQVSPVELKLFLTVGFLGGLTTFSTFNLEVFELLKTGKVFWAFLYMFLSCAIGLSAVFLGYYLYLKIK